MKFRITLFNLLFVIYGHDLLAGESLLDFWEQASRTVVVGSPKADSSEVEKRQHVEYENPDVSLCFDKAKVGAFSIKPVKAGPLTVLASIWGKTLPVPPKAALEFWLGAVEASQSLPENISVSLYGEDDRRVEVTARHIGDDADWGHYGVDLPTETPERLKSISLELGNTGMLLDGMILRAGEQVVGLTDKPLQQLMQEAADTRSERVRVAFENGTKTTTYGGELRQCFDRLYLGEDIEESNVKMQKFLKDEYDRLKQNKAALWDLALNVRLIEAYYELGSKSDRKPAPLRPETEKLLLEVLWERTKDKNDYGWAQSNTWWLTASENHDLNAKVCNLISARIFMNEPDYRDRPYPDAARGPGHGYWTHMTYGGKDEGYGPDSAAPWKSTGSHNAAAHYKAWMAFFQRYLGERAKRGFFLERASPVYMKWTLDFLHTLRSYCGNEALRKKLGDFFNVVWADWAQEQIAGRRGGSKTRAVGPGGYDSMEVMACFHLGGPGTTNFIYAAMLLDDYDFDPIVFDMALDSRGRGTYEIASRGVGEEEGPQPRPEGMERTLMTDRDARFLKYSWVTPNYILGTQMDHPSALHSHLSVVGRWHGLIVGGSPDTHIVPTSGVMEGDEEGKKIDMDTEYLTAQYKNILVGQQNRRWMQATPEWFPAKPLYQKPVILSVGKGWDEIEEEGGWVFFRKGDAFVAVREVLPVKSEDRTGPRHFQTDISVKGNPLLVQILDRPVEWTAAKDGIVLADKFSPFIIHAGSKAEHGSLASFREIVLKSKIELRKTVVPGFYILAYQGGEPGSQEIIFPANTPGMPRIGGKPIDYLPAALFSGPYVQSRFGSGKIKIAKDERELLLNFE